MERRPELMIFLDTHVVVWLYDALLKRISKKAQTAINANPVYISPIVKLELQYLFEIGKINTPPDLYIVSLGKSIGLRMAKTELDLIVAGAISNQWTRDPFDRMIVAEAHANNAHLVTADKMILKHYPLAVW